MNDHFVICECASSEHIVRFIHDEEDNTIYTSVQLIQYRSFWKRLVVAVKYLLGYTSRYGVWDCTSMSRLEAEKLANYIQHNMGTVHSIREY